MDLLWKILAALLVLTLFRHFVLTIVRVKGNSMLPTLKNGDILIAWKLLSRLNAFRRGDIVLCHYPGRFVIKGKYLRQCFVKRVVGLPGEWLAIDHKRLLINGIETAQPYLSEAYAHGRGVVKQRIVGRNSYFVMGDNRDCSHDSRSVGYLYRTMISGKVIAVIHVPEFVSQWLQREDRKLDDALRKARSRSTQQKTWGSNG